MNKNIHTRLVVPLTRFEQLLDKFKKSKFDYPNIHDIANPSYQILWVLRALYEKFNV